MIDRTKELLPQMQEKFPHIYDIYNEKTILYALLSVYADKSKERLRIIDRLYAMIGIDSTYDEDLEYRWGSLLGVYRNKGESYSDYRSRLLIIYSSLAGGTAEAIKYAIASTIGISSDTDAINKYIKVYDAWEYPEEVLYKSLTNKDNVFLNQNFVTNMKIISTDYGHIICTIDLEANESITTMYDKIMTAIKKTKASGIYPYLLFIYITNEIATIKYNEYLRDKLTDGFSDVSFIASCVDNVDDWYDIVAFSTVVEKGLLTSVKSNTWSWDIGNTNDDMTTKYVDTDWKYDIIKSLTSEGANISIDESNEYIVGDVYNDQHTIIGNKSDGDKFLDDIKDAIHEINKIGSKTTNIWSYLGTNCAIINNDFVTNIFMDTDAYDDIIIYN